MKQVRVWLVKIDNIRGNNSGAVVALQDICMKPFGSACASQTILQALIARISPGLEQQVALPRDSYLQIYKHFFLIIISAFCALKWLLELIVSDCIQGYFDNITEHLRVGPPFSSSNQTNLLCSIRQCSPTSLLNEISRAAESPEKSFIAKPAASWLDDFLVWMSPDAFGCCWKFLNGSYCPPDDQANKATISFQITPACPFLVLQNHQKEAS
ncbi:hypothetical protein L7F22_015056 [Adiantum nelumboides]|nr:hypothetical protein [Adiantum nelumboides]